MHGKINRQSQKDINISEPSDKSLNQLLTDNLVFKKSISNACAINQLRQDDVEKCLGGLYHEASKKVHGHDGQVAIDHRDWATNEVLALAVLFKHFKINFVFFNMEGDENPLPFKI